MDGDGPSLNRDQKYAQITEEMVQKAAATSDGFQNFLANLGLQSDNLSGGSTYGFSPVTRIRPLLEWVHRGTWVGGVAIDLVADDMTREGIELIANKLKPDQTSEILANLEQTDVWGGLNDAIKWARLYGGSLAVFQINGQRTDTPLRIDTVGKGDFLGLHIMDRWQVTPNLNPENMIQEPGPNFGLPKYYDVVTMAGQTIRRIHYTRCIRLIGVKLPYWQAIYEQFWGLSILERIWDRMVAFDSATAGASQLVYKSFLRTLKMPGLRQAVMAGQQAMQGVIGQVNMMRRYQSIEGITLIDGMDEMEYHSHGAISGIAEALLQFGQQLSGALQIPLVRFFGQSPAGLNSSGDSDLRTYYDGVNHQQRRMLRSGMMDILQLTARSLGIKLPPDFNFLFRPLWQLTGKDKTEIGKTTADSIIGTYEAGIITRRVALEELRESSRQTGLYSNISDEDIEDADNEPPISEQNEQEAALELTPEMEVDPETGQPKNTGGNAGPGMQRPQLRAIAGGRND
jgi:phage-related protein (TIGR01555 family)